MAVLFIYAVGIVIFWALLALPVMKFYARAIPLSQLALIALWAFGRMMVAYIIVELIWLVGLHETGRSTPPLLVFAIICIAGWLISRSLKAKGIERPYPGIGARAVAGILVFMSAIIGVLWLTGVFKLL